MDAWVERLKAAYDAGYYSTESAEGEQEPFPWQNKTCRNCPFWLNNVCRVQAVQRKPDDLTCEYFDPRNHAEADAIIQARMAKAKKAWGG